MAALILDNHRRGCRRMLWLSASPDLRVDAERDLRDLRAPDVDDITRYTSSDLPKLGARLSSHGVKDGLLFCTYSLLTRGCVKPTKVNIEQMDPAKVLVPGSRGHQLVSWLQARESDATRALGV